MTGLRAPIRLEDDRAEPSFFISYSHTDTAYVELLAAHLAGAGLPVWFDAGLGWGARFTADVRRRLTDALAVIVVMSPAAEASEWVEREVLEGQRCDREFLPVLLAGSRFFLLATRHFFDARGGALPGERELRQLRAVRDDRLTGAAADRRLVLRPPRQAAGSTHPAAAESLHKLRALLDADELGLADILTTSVLLDSVGRLEAGWLRRRADGAGLPLGLLADVDAAWSRSSAGRHGFQAQLDRYAGPAPGVPPGTERDFSALARALGWRSDDRGTTPRYGAFAGAGGPADGFFPTLRNPQIERHASWHDQWVETVMGVHLRLRGQGG
jgi:TIR domain/GUN4-like